MAQPPDNEIPAEWFDRLKMLETFTDSIEDMLIGVDLAKPGEDKTATEILARQHEKTARLGAGYGVGPVQVLTRDKIYTLAKRYQDTKAYVWPDNVRHPIPPQKPQKPPKPVSRAVRLAREMFGKTFAIHSSRIRTNRRDRSHKTMLVVMRNHATLAPKRVVLTKVGHNDWVLQSMEDVTWKA